MTQAAQIITFPVERRATRKSMNLSGRTLDDVRRELANTLPPGPKLPDPGSMTGAADMMEWMCDSLLIYERAVFA